MKDANAIRVVPRVDRKTGEALLFLPDSSEPRALPYVPHIGMYAHVGQHGMASRDYYRSNTRPPQNGECADLLREYANIPPVGAIVVLKRMPRFV